MNDVISSVIRNSQVFTKNYSPETGPIHFAYPFISYPLPIPSFSSMIMIDYHQYRIPLDYLPYQPCICSYFKKISFFCRSKMGLLAQIGLLFWKDLLIITRSKIWIICEILFSLLLLPYIILLVKYVSLLNINIKRKIRKYYLLRYQKNRKKMHILSNLFPFPAIHQILTAKSTILRQLTDIIIATTIFC
jgi:hypothetical protein